jgi:transcriptional regulator with XRE-family HTH domain
MSTGSQGRQRQIRTPDELGTVISELRSHRRKTQFELASALGIDRSQLAHLEGGRSGRYLAHLLNIVDHLGAELQIYWPAESADTSMPSGLEPSFGLSNPRAMAGGKSPVSNGPSSRIAKPSASEQDISQAAEVDADPTRLLQPVLDEDEIAEALASDTATDLVEDLVKDPFTDRANDPEKYPVEDAPEKPDAQAAPSPLAEPTSAQLTKITNLAMNVMAASQQRSGQPRPTQ